MTEYTIRKTDGISVGRWKDRQDAIDALKYQDGIVEEVVRVIV